MRKLIGLIAVLCIALPALATSGNSESKTKVKPVVNECSYELNATVVSHYDAPVAPEMVNSFAGYSTDTLLTSVNIIKPVFLLPETRAGSCRDISITSFYLRSNPIITNVGKYALSSNLYLNSRHKDITRPGRIRNKAITDAPLRLCTSYNI